ncbi:MAG TPA: precorrin-8X methylmutase [Candidatus Competibacteraceae bacterium]|nr:precorrin-8X methylmutase [Candidatus Competibacteraceae bacterium]HRZ06602.1 precorrin-8X methylmutase [Candidatus Competibacteraceae bacterium]HSA46706.1 precorrin-8X methylmutase [Candidatus Competibacteraceae bacterium]
MPRFDYLRDPDEIERQSFGQIRQLTDLSRFDSDQQQVAMRLVHTSGDPGIVHDLYFSPGAVEAGLAALQQNADVLCDIEMVSHGISKRYLQGQVHCFLNSPTVAERARQTGETRSMAAMTEWPTHLGGSIVAIGNAPTALFRLLELLDEGASRPALIIGMPVGFINAAESKQALWDVAPSEFQTPCITLLGRRGGSSLAAATLNALARMAHGIRF